MGLVFEIYSENLKNNYDPEFPLWIWNQGKSFALKIEVNNTKVDDCCFKLLQMKFNLTWY